MVETFLSLPSLLRLTLLDCLESHLIPSDTAIPSQKCSSRLKRSAMLNTVQSVAVPKSIATGFAVLGALLVARFDLFELVHHVLGPLLCPRIVWLFTNSWIFLYFSIIM